MADWANTLPRKSWATGHRRSCLTKNWTESTPSERRLWFVLPPVGASPLPPEEQTALTKIVTCQNYCNLLLQFANNFYCQFIIKRYSVSAHALYSSSATPFFKIGHFSMNTNSSFVNGSIFNLKDFGYPKRFKEMSQSVPL